MERTYICIDLKSYYASVECVHRGLDPLKANLLVADPSRSDQTICLAVSPSLKAIGTAAIKITKNEINSFFATFISRNKFNSLPIMNLLIFEFKS